MRQHSAVISSTALTRAGRRFAPDSSAKTNRTRTTVPRSRLVIHGVDGVVPQLCENRIRRLGQGGQSSRPLARQIVLQAFFHGFPYVLSDGLIPSRGSQPVVPPDASILRPAGRGVDIGAAYAMPALRQAATVAAS